MRQQNQAHIATEHNDCYGKASMDSDQLYATVEGEGSNDIHSQHDTPGQVSSMDPDSDQLYATVEGEYSNVHSQYGTPQRQDSSMDSDQLYSTVEGDVHSQHGTLGRPDF